MLILPAPSRLNRILLMLSNRLPALLVIALLGAAPFVVEAADREGANPESLPDFQRDVLPILRSHCAGCHGAKKQEANLRLDNLATDLAENRVAAERWQAALNMLNAGEMPPEDAKPLSSKERETFTRWISAAIEEAAAAQRNSSGRVVLRRLNRVEYQNTMSGLLGLEMDYAGDLPPDAVSADGFTNDGRSLQMSALRLEYYLDTARRALDRVIVEGEAPQVYDYEFSESNVKAWMRGSQRANRLGRQQEFLATMVDDYPEEGEFLVRVELSAELKPDVGFPLLEVAVGYRPDTKILFREFDLVEIFVARSADAGVSRSRRKFSAAGPRAREIPWIGGASSQRL